jgi:hypothetical protein
MSGHPLLEVVVGGVEVEVVKGVVPVVERGTGERSAEGEGEGCCEKQKKEAQEACSKAGMDEGMGCGSFRGRD